MFASTDSRPVNPVILSTPLANPLRSVRSMRFQSPAVGHSNHKERKVRKERSALKPGQDQHHEQDAESQSYPIRCMLLVLSATARFSFQLLDPAKRFGEDGSAFFPHPPASPVLSILLILSIPRACLLLPT